MFKSQSKFIATCKNHVYLFAINFDLINTSLKQLANPLLQGMMPPGATGLYGPGMIQF